MARSPGAVAGNDQYGPQGLVRNQRRGAQAPGLFGPCKGQARKSGNGVLWNRFAHFVFLGLLQISTRCTIHSLYPLHEFVSHMTFNRLNLNPPHLKANLLRKIMDNLSGKTILLANSQSGLLPIHSSAAMNVFGCVSNRGTPKPLVSSWFLFKNELKKGTLKTDRHTYCG